MSELTTVVIPVHNGAGYLAQAVESVKQQTLRGAEIVVVDDGSTDATAKVATNLPGIIYVHQERGGPAAALNHGIRMATRKFIAFVSADDVWCPDKLALQHSALGSNAEGKLVFGHMKHFLTPEIEQAAEARRHCPTEPMAAFSAGTMLATLDTVRSVGPFNQTYKLGEFMDWYGRAIDLGMETIMLPNVVLLRRVHGANYSTRSLRTTSYVPVLKSILDRRRTER